MHLETLLLGMLRVPASGSELKTELDARGRHWWAAELSQIYPCLAGLARDGLLSSWREPSVRGPARRVYGLTDAGRRELAERLAAGPVTAPERLPWLAQVRVLAGADTPDAARRFLERLADHFSAEQAALADVQARWTSAVPDFPRGLDDDGFFLLSALRCAQDTVAARRRWCERTLAELAARSSG